MLGYLLSALLAASSALAITPRWHYEAAYDNWAEGDWHRDEDNENATLAWGESYVMMSLASMYRTTGDPIYLDRLAWHIDGVLEQRDDARGVTDYRGLSGACWRTTAYSDEPYCWLVHSGMIGFPIADFAALVRETDRQAHHAADGETYGDKAERYVTAAIEVFDAHEDQWNDAGWYVFREDADFTGYPGVDVPYNQNAAMGRMVLALYRATGDSLWRERAVAMGEYFVDGLSVGSSGEYLWNYWGGTYVEPGEDLSHAFINVAFAIELAAAGLVFDDADLWAFSETLVSQVYIDDYTHTRFVGGGTTNYSSDPWITALWAPLTPWRTTVYTVGRNLYDREVDPESLSSGWLLLGWALLAEHQPPHCAHFFYSVDWEDQEGWRQATAYSSNILTVPPRFDQGCMIPLEFEAVQPVTVGQWDGTVYHPVARWQGTGTVSTRFLPYEPAWPTEYWKGGALFQFADDFVSGQGIRVREPDALTPPTITSPAPDSCIPGETLTWESEASGDTPLWWSLESPPLDARVDAATGTLTWTPVESCTASFVLRVDNDVGSDTLTWSFSDETGSGDTGTPGDTGTTGDTGSGEAGGLDSETDTGSAAEGLEDSARGSSCGCTSRAAGGGWLWLVGLGALGARRQRRQVRPDRQPPHSSTGTVW